MSRSFTKIFSNNLDILLNTKNTKIDMNRLKANFLVSGSIIILHGLYAFTTSDNDKSVIVKKYKMVRNGYTDFMVVDNNGKHFNVNNSLWYWKWDSVEDWNNIKEGQSLKYKYYGWRVPFLGMFPNIYKSSNKTLHDDKLTHQSFVVTNGNLEVA